MSKTTGRRIRIESTDNPDGKKITWLGKGGRILIDDQDVSSQVAAIDIHLDPHSTPVAHVQMMGLDIALDAEEAQGGNIEPRWLEAVAPLPLLCVPCYAEQLAGQRTEASPAILVVGGTSTCAEHLTIQQGPAIPGRTASGLIINGD